MVVQQEISMLVCHSIRLVSTSQRNREPALRIAKHHKTIIAITEHYINGHELCSENIDHKKYCRFECTTTNIYIMDPLPLPEFTLFFDGATHNGNPGLGGAAAVIRIDDNRDNDVKVWNRMGFVGSNCAEYYGLILGLRELLHLYPTSPFSLIIKGDSELVIKQLVGKYEVHDEVLKNYHFVAKSLLEKMKADIFATDAGGKIALKHIYRDRNQEADALAKRAAKMSVNPRLRFFHYPCLGSFINGHFHGTTGMIKAIPVAHNWGAAAYTPEVYVDAGFLRLMNGDAALSHIKPTGKKNLIEGKADMTVLGITSVKVSFDNELITIEDALVVDFLPWPMQISHYHPSISSEISAGIIHNIRIWRSLTPERFRSHPYWSSDKHVVGSL